MMAVNAKRETASVIAAAAAQIDCRIRDKNAEYQGVR